MNSSPMMNVMKGVAIGMTAGVCMGIVGKNMGSIIKVGVRDRAYKKISKK